MQETGLGSEMVRAPRLPLEGAEREEILGIVRHAIATPAARSRARHEPHEAASASSIPTPAASPRAWWSPAGRTWAAARWPSGWSASAREFDSFRSAVVNEPRGNDAMVGALLCEPSDPACDAGVIFFNNVGYLGMCGHGTIGLVVTLAHLGRIATRDTLPAGDRRAAMVEARLNANGSVTIRNVASYRSAGARAGGSAGNRHGVRRHRLGRQLVFPVRRARPGARARPRRSSSPISPGASAQALEAQGITGADGGDDRPHRAVRPAHARPAPTARISCSAPARPTTARPAAPAPAPSWPACTPTASCGPARSGGRRASSAACSRARSRVVDGKLYPGDHRLRLRERRRPT